MLHTTRAIVLRTIKHGDRTTVMKAYTEAFGTRSYMVRSPKSGVRAAALQPLARVELVVTESHDREMHAVREMRVDRPYQRVAVEPQRGMLALFTQEVLYRTLREETADPLLFAFVDASLEAMDHAPSLALYPIGLLVGLARHLGFFPEQAGANEDRFDLREGFFFQGDPPHELCMEPPQAHLFARMMERGFGEEVGSAPRSDGDTRRKLLDDLLIYYRLHVDGFGELRSLDVLHQVLH